MKMRSKVAVDRGWVAVRALVLLGAFGAAGVVPMWAKAHPHKESKHDYKREVEELEEQWRTAQLAGDVVTMDKMLSDDYIGISMTGQVNTKAQQLDRVRTKSFMLTKIDVAERKVKLIGKIAIVTARAEVEGTNEGTSMQGTFRYTRVYQRLATGEWKITSFEATRVPKPREPHAGA